MYIAAILDSGEKAWTGEQIKPFNFDEPLEFFAEILPIKSTIVQNCDKKINANF